MESSTALVKTRSFKSYANNFIVTRVERMHMFKTKDSVKKMIQMETRAHKD